MLPDVVTVTVCPDTNEPLGFIQELSAFNAVPLYVFSISMAFIVIFLLLTVNVPFAFVIV